MQRISISLSILLLPIVALAYPAADQTPDRSYAEKLRYAPSYKIRPSEDDRLTVADIVGPDGIVYPDFGMAGLADDFVYPETIFKIKDFGAVADDEEDDTDALEAALTAAVKNSGGIVEFGSGTYLLSRPVRITADHIVIRGAGKDETHLKFDYKLEPQSVNFFLPKEGDTIGPADVIEVHSHPKRMKEHAIYANDKFLFKRGPDTSGGQRFSLVTLVRHFPSSIKAGEVTLKAVVKRFDGTTTEESITANYDPAANQKAGSTRATHSVGAFTLLGDNDSSQRQSIGFAEKAVRGTRDITLDNPHDFQAGDFIKLEAKTDEAWLEHTASARPDFDPRLMTRIATVEGNTITLEYPLRMDFPVQTRIRRVWPIQNSGIEALTFEQTSKQWIDAIYYDGAYNCLVRDVNIKRCGRNPITLGNALHCEIRDSQFGRPFFAGGGGTGYLGFSGTWNSLIENIEADGLRHAPAIQAFASGNVIRESKLISSDANYHMLWAHENLIEQCELDAERGTGSYGYAVFAQTPETDIHGPGGGPRNVIYNNRFKSPRSGIYLGGSNENWIIAHNDFKVASGPGMLIRNHSFDHIIWNNLLVMGEAAQPAILLEDADCLGVEVVGNQVAGSETIVSGEADPLILQGNARVTLGELSRTTPAVPSIYLWQKENQPFTQTTKTTPNE